jgi:hypothetical protein
MKVSLGLHRCLTLTTTWGDDNDEDEDFCYNAQKFDFWLKDRFQVAGAEMQVAEQGRRSEIFESTDHCNQCQVDLY